MSTKRARKKREFILDNGTKVVFLTESSEIEEGTVIGFLEDTKEYIVETNNCQTLKTKKVFTNPIKDGRIVHDITFATRLCTFLKHCGENYGPNDFLVDEEWQYLLSVAKKLEKFQRITVFDPSKNGEESKYFSNLGKTIGKEVLI